MRRRASWPWPPPRRTRAAKSADPAPDRGNRSQAPGHRVQIDRTGGGAREAGREGWMKTCSTSTTNFRQQAWPGRGGPGGRQLHGLPHEADHADRRARQKRKGDRALRAVRANSLLLGVSEAGGVSSEALTGPSSPFGSNSSSPEWKRAPLTRSPKTTSTAPYSHPSPAKPAPAASDRPAPFLPHRRTLRSATAGPQPAPPADYGLRNWSPSSGKAFAGSISQASRPCRMRSAPPAPRPSHASARSATAAPGG